MLSEIIAVKQRPLYANLGDRLTAELRYDRFVQSISLPTGPGCQQICSGGKAASCFGTLQHPTSQHYRNEMRCRAT
jgi:hypothetical protein